jgi:hypothetical protein
MCAYRVTVLSIWGAGFHDIGETVFSKINQRLVDFLNLVKFGWASRSGV